MGLALIKEDADGDEQQRACGGPSVESGCCDGTERCAGGRWSGRGALLLGEVREAFVKVRGWCVAAAGSCDCGLEQALRKRLRSAGWAIGKVRLSRGELIGRELAVGEGVEEIGREVIGHARVSFDKVGVDGMGWA